MELDQRFTTGGETELEELISCYGEKLLRYATSILYNHQDAEDVVQDVIITAYQKRSTFDGKNLSAWLYKITYNNCMNKIKSRRKILFFSEVQEEQLTYVEDTDSTTDIMAAIKKLKPQDRALLFGRIFNGQSYEELAEILGSSETALRKQYERAKRKVIKYLALDEDESELEIPHLRVVNG